MRQKLHKTFPRLMQVPQKGNLSGANAGLGATVQTGNGGRRIQIVWLLAHFAKKSMPPRFHSQITPCPCAACTYAASSPPSSCRPSLVRSHPPAAASSPPSTSPSAAAPLHCASPAATPRPDSAPHPDRLRGDTHAELRCNRCATPREGQRHRGGLVGRTSATSSSSPEQASDLVDSAMKVHPWRRKARRRRRGGSAARGEAPARASGQREARQGSVRWSRCRHWRFSLSSSQQAAAVWACHEEAAL
jgi:hypothetical protein